MKRLGQRTGRSALYTVILAAIWLAGCAPPAPAGPQYAAMVIDARTGKVLHSRNADTRLHPASLTKMMTLYIAFEAVERGEISLDTKVRISKNATLEPPSKIYLKEGQTIAFRYLIRAAAVKSANDAATAIGEAVSGSEDRFIRRMNNTAKALGMDRTTFKNAHGLTASGHLSTARDMTTLGRHLFYDYPEYYNLFSRRTTQVGSTTVANTNRRLLAAYRGADGIKTGYTRAAGSNLVASAERGDVRIIATMFGGSSSAARNKRVAELLDMGFSRAPSRVAVVKPSPPSYRSTPVVSRTHVAQSPLPVRRPGSIIALAAAQQVELAAIAPDAMPLLPAARPEQEPAEAELAALDAQPLPETEDPGTESPEVAIEVAAAEATTAAEPAAEIVSMRLGVEQTLNELAAVSDAPDMQPQTVAAVMTPPEPLVTRPMRRPARVTFSTADMRSPVVQESQTVTRISTARVPASWGVRVGRYPTRGQAERMLLRTALQQIDLLGSAQRQVVARNSGYEVEFVGLSEQDATLTCQRLSARDERCSPFGS